MEVQVFGDAGGRVVHLHERECSIQRRHQKLVEESPAPAPVRRRSRRGSPRPRWRGARAVGYVNAGTMEFIVQGDEFYFLEMNTRLQVEHPVTEEVTGLDLVQAQLHVAGGGSLPWTQEQVGQRGASIECRIYAEDPAKGFMPSPGRITRLVLPEGPGVRLECGVAEGVEVTVHYDPLLAKLITAGSTRDEAIARMSAALDGFVVEGVKTAIPFQQRVMRSAAFQAGTRAHADGRAGRLRVGALARAMETSLTDARIRTMTGAGFWRNESLADYLDRWARERPARTALVDGRGRTTWEELARAVDRVAHGLARARGRAGQRHLLPAPQLERGDRGLPGRPAPGRR